MKAKETAVVLIEFQNDFCKQGGKLHDGVKGELERQNTIPNAMKLAEGARKKGATVIHSPFVFNEKYFEDHQIKGIVLRDRRTFLTPSGHNNVSSPGYISKWQTSSNDRQTSPAHGHLSSRQYYADVIEITPIFIAKIRLLDIQKRPIVRGVLGF